MNTSTKSLVSIGLPTYNRGYCIRRCLDSLLGQTYPFFELIISDNASTDNTREICEAYAARDSRIRYIRQEKNTGMAANFYAVLASARGDYFCWVGDDDWYAKEYIQQHLEALEEHPAYGAAGCSFQLVYDNGDPEQEIVLKDDFSLTGLNSYQLYARVLAKKKWVHHMFHGMYRKDIIRGILDHPLSFRKGWDFIVISELALATRFYSLEPVLRFVSHRRAGPEDTNYYRSPERMRNAVRKRKTILVSHTYSTLMIECVRHTLRSSLVPWWRKLFIFIPVMSAMWMRRQRMFGFFYASPRRFFTRAYWRGIGLPEKRNGRHL